MFNFTRVTFRCFLLHYTSNKGGCNIDYGEEIIQFLQSRNGKARLQRFSANIQSCANVEDNDTKLYLRAVEKHKGISVRAGTVGFPKSKRAMMMHTEEAVLDNKLHYSCFSPCGKSWSIQVYHKVVKNSSELSVYKIAWSIIHRKREVLFISHIC